MTVEERKQARNATPAAQFREANKDLTEEQFKKLEEMTPQTI